MTIREDRPGDGAWRRIERLLPTPDELPQGPRDTDTELHAISGWQPPMAGWIVQSIKDAAEKLSVRGERGEARIPGVPQRRVVQSRPPHRKVATFRDVVGDEATDKFIEDEKRAREEAQQRRLKDPNYRRMIRHMTRRMM